MSNNKALESVISSYAKALFNLATTANLVDRVLEESDFCVIHLFSDKKFVVLLEAPHIDTKEKHTVVSKIMHSHFCELIENIVHLLIDKNHPELATHIFLEYSHLVDRSKRVMYGDVISANSISSDEQSQIQKNLESFMQKKMHIRFLTDSNLIGGVVFRSDDCLIDQSVRGHLRRVGELLEKVAHK